MTERGIEAKLFFYTKLSLKEKFSFVFSWRQIEKEVNVNAADVVKLPKHRLSHFLQCNSIASLPGKRQCL